RRRAGAAGSCTPPEPRRALEAAQRHLARARPGTPPRVLAEARLRQAELHLQLGEPTQARAVLLKLGADAPADLRYQARARLARSLQDEDNWAAAVDAWKEAREEARQVPDQLGGAQYYLGHCLARSGRSGEAAAAWEEVVQRDAGPAAQAAALRL